jgi:hypothetical protein
MDAEVLAALVRYVKIGLVVIQTRIMVLLGLLLSAGGTAWTLYEPTWERVAASALFAILVFWPVIRLERKDGQVATKTD